MTSANTNVDPVDEARRKWIANGWLGTADAAAFVSTLFRTHQILLRKLDAHLRPFDLTFARYELLMLLLLSKRGSLPLTLINQRLQVQPASTSNLLDGLTRVGLVRRELHPKSNREKIVYITPKGRKLIEEANSVLNDEFFAHLPISEKCMKDVIDILREFRSEVVG